MAISSDRGRAAAWAAPGLFVLIVLIVYPLLTLLIQAVMPELFAVHPRFTVSLRGAVSTFTSLENLKAIGNSLEIGIAASVLATVYGTVTAFAVEHSARRTGAVIEALVWGVFFLPSYVVTEGWLVLLQDGGILAQLLHLPNGWSSWFFSRFGVIMVMGFRFFPFVHFAMQSAIRNVGPGLVHAARLSGAKPAAVAIRVVVPLLMPALLAGASLAFAEGFGDFGIAAAIAPQMHVPLVTYQIFTALNQAPVDYGSAATLALIVVLVTAGAIGLQQLVFRGRSYATVSHRNRASASRSGKRGGVVTLSAVILGLAFVVPLGASFCASLWKVWSNGVAPGNWTFLNYVQVLHGDLESVSHAGNVGGESLLRSIEYAFIAAAAAAAIGLWIGYQLTFRKTRADRIVNILIMATVAIPGVVIAASFIFAWNAVWLIPLHLVIYGTPICLAMAYVAISLPYAIRLQIGAMAQLPGSLLTAAQVLGARGRTVVMRIVLPLVSATTISTFFMTFAGVVFELPASSLLYPPGSPVFPITIQARFNNFDWAQGSALGIMGVLVVFLFYGAGRFILSRAVRIQEEKR